MPDVFGEDYGGNWDDLKPLTANGLRNPRGLQVATRPQWRQSQISSLPKVWWVLQVFSSPVLEFQTEPLLPC